MFFHLIILKDHLYHQLLIIMFKNYLLNLYLKLFFKCLLNVYIIHITFHYHLINIFNYLLMVYLFIYNQYYLITHFNMFLIYQI
jgi:hypothetical protein